MDKYCIGVLNFLQKFLPWSHPVKMEAGSKMKSPERDERKTKRKRSGDEGEDEERESISQASTSKMKIPSHSAAHKPAELFRKDLISAMKLPDSEPLAPEEYLLIADSWRQEWERGVQVPVNEVSIPSVNISDVVEKYPVTGDFKIPKKILHACKDDTYKQGMHELTGMTQLSEQVVRYDLDDLDVCWLTEVNYEREEMGEAMIHEWTMERVIESLESQCHDNMEIKKKTEEGLGIEYDEDIVCEICRSPDSEDSNEMVFCDGCDICVHQACYGIQTVPEGSWLCRTCALGVKPSCILCPKMAGAMKSTRSGTKWAHVSCAIWIPEVTIGCVDKMEPITKISQIPASRWALICVICKERVGACIQCSVKACKTAFHVTCAFGNSLEMKTVLVEDEKSADDAVKLKAYCPKHSRKRDRNASDSEPDSPRKSINGSPKKEMTEEEKATLRADRLEMLENEFYQEINCREIATLLQLDEDIIDLIFIFWKLKRKTNFNKPLLTPKTEEEDLLEKQQEDSLVARMKMFVHLRQDLERVRNLSYMVSRREKMKRQFVKARESVFYAALDVLRDNSLNLSTKDVDKVVQQYRDVACSGFKSGKARIKLEKKSSRGYHRKEATKESDSCSETADKGKYSPSSVLDSDQSSVSSFLSSKHSPPNLTSTELPPSQSLSSHNGGGRHRGNLLVDSLSQQTSDNDFEDDVLQLHRPTPKRKSLALKSRRRSAFAVFEKEEIVKIEKEECIDDERNSTVDELSINSTLEDDTINSTLADEREDVNQISHDVKQEKQVEETSSTAVTEPVIETESDPVMPQLTSPTENSVTRSPKKKRRRRGRPSKAHKETKPEETPVENHSESADIDNEPKCSLSEETVTKSTSPIRKHRKRRRTKSRSHSESNNVDVSLVKTEPNQSTDEIVDVESTDDTLVAAEQKDGACSIVDAEAPQKRTRSNLPDNLSSETLPNHQPQSDSEIVVENSHNTDLEDSKVAAVQDTSDSERISPLKETRSVVAKMTEEERLKVIKSLPNSKYVSPEVRTELNSYFQNNRLCVSDKLKRRVQNHLLKGKRKRSLNGVLDKSQSQLDSFFRPVNNHRDSQSPVRQIETRSSQNSSPVPRVDLSRILNELSPTRDRLAGDANNVFDSSLLPRSNSVYRMSKRTGSTPDSVKSSRHDVRISVSPDLRSVRTKIEGRFISSSAKDGSCMSVSSRETTPESTSSYNSRDRTNSSSVRARSVTPISLGKTSEDLEIENMCDDSNQRRRTRSQIVTDTNSKEGSLSPKGSLRSHIRTCI